MKKLRTIWRTRMGKVVSVVVSLALVAMVCNLAAFASIGDNQEEATDELTAIEQQTEVTTDEAVTADEQAEEPATEEAVTTDEQAGDIEVAFDVDDQATVKVVKDGNETALTQKTYTQASDKDLVFKVEANDGFELDTVKAEDADGAQVQFKTVEQNTYTVAADAIKAGLKITVKTVETTASEPAAADEQKATEEENTDADDEGDQQAPASETTTPATELTAKHVGGLFGVFGGISVTVTADEGVLPEGTTMKVTSVKSNAVEAAVEDAVEAQGRSVADMVAVDITLYDADGNEVQPNGVVNVTFANANLSGDQFAVYHVNDEATVAEQASMPSSSPVATVEHFSTYVLVGIDNKDTPPVEGTKVVTVNYVSENGVILGSFTSSINKDDDGKYEYSHEVGTEGDSYTVAKGYMLDSKELTVEGNTLTGIFNTNETVNIQVTVKAKTVNYMVTVYVANADGQYPKTASATDTMEGKVGDMTNVTADSEELTKIIKKIESPTDFDTVHFDMQYIEQKVIAVDDNEECTTEVKVYFDRNEYKLTYNTDGGSYVAPKKDAYDSDVIVYSEGKPELICDKEEHAHTDSCYTTALTCGKTEHTHSTMPTERPEDYKNQKIGCYTSQKSGGWMGIGGKWSWKLTCTETVHTHSANCYTTALNCGKTEHTHTDACYSTGITPAPTKQGYVFAGWYTDEACTVKADGTIKLTGDTTVYAKWTPKTVNYTIVYLIENADDDEYSYLTSAASSAEVGTSVTASGAPAPEGLDTTNFTFKKGTTATVKADGSTVVTAYYSRNVYTITWNGEYYYDGKGHSTQKSGRATLTAKYGSNITTKWQETFNKPYGEAWNFTTDNDDKFVTIDTMPSGNKEVYQFYFATYNVQTLSYWLEGYTDNGAQQKTRGGVTYGLYKAMDVQFNYLYDDADFYEIIGYTKGDYEGCTFGTQTWDGQKVSFYYLAQSYNLDLYGYDGNLISSNSVKLNADITNYLTEPTQKPDDEAVFDGWFEDPDHSKPYTGTTMPMGLALYAGWHLPDKTLTCDANYTDAPAAQTITVQKGSVAQGITTPERNGYDFAGWYTDEECTTEFDVNQPISADTTIYAKWVESKTMTVTIKHVMKGQSEPFVTTTDTVRKGSNYLARALGSEEVKDKLGEGTYIVDEATKTIVASDGDDTITFTYDKLQNHTYTVQYKDSDGKVVDDLTESKTPSSIDVTEDASPDAVKYAAEHHQQLTATKKTLTISSDDNMNVITFEMKPKDYTITYKGVEDADFSGAATEYSYGRETTVPNPSKDGYYFLGWKVDTTEGADYTGVDHGNGIIDAIFDIDPDEEAYARDITISEKSYGDLTLTACWAQIQVSAGSYKCTYDGKEHGVGATVTSTLPAGWYAEASVSKKYTDAGTYTMTCDNLVIKNSKGTDVTEALEKAGAIKKTDGTLKITPAAVTVTAQNASKAYGEKDPAFTAEVAGVVDGTQIAYSVSRTNTDENVGTYTGVIVPAGEATQGNYTVTYVAADFQITKAASLTVTGTDYNGTYDAAAHGTAAVASVTEGTAVSYSTDNGKTWSATVPTITNVGTTTVQVKAENDNYETATASYKLTVTPAAVTVTAQNASKAYGQADPAFTAEVAGVVDGTQIAYSVSRTNTDENVGTYTGVIVPAGEATQGNYTVTYVAADFKITKQTITPPGPGEDPDPSYLGVEVSQPADTVYNGHEQKQLIKVTDKNGNKLVEGTDYEISYTEAVNAGTVTATITGKGNYTGEVERTYKIKPVEITITSASAEKVYNGSPLTKQELVGEPAFVEGEGATYSFTGTQTYVGSSENIFEYTLNEGTLASNYSIKTVYGTLKVTEPSKPSDPTDPSWPTHKTHMSVDYDLGDTITFDISVTNIYDHEANITIDEQKGVTITGKSSWTDVKPGETVTSTATHVVTEDDILNGFTNTVTATIGDVQYPGDDPVPTIKDANPQLKVTKTSDNEGAAVLGQTLTYSVEVENTGNVTITGITVDDELTGQTGISVGDLKPGEKTTVQVGTYTVTETDIQNGYVTNNVTAKGTDPKGVTHEYTGEKTDQTVKVYDHITVTKNSDATGALKLGDTVTYRIEVLNDGNQTRTNVVVTDKLTNDEWTIASLAPGEKVEYTATYTVTADDIKAGKVVNTATTNTTTDDPGVKEDPTDPINGRAIITKHVTSTPANGSYYVAGETITYSISAENVGNVDLTNLAITDELTGASWTVENLAVGATSETFTTSYTVTADDAAAGRAIVNVATGTATIPDAPAGTDDPTIVPGTSEPANTGVVPTPPSGDGDTVVPTPLVPVVNALSTAVTGEAVIDDDGTPLVSAEEIACWVHIWMIIGMILTLVYGMGVSIRRGRFTSVLSGYEDDVLGNREE